jgi:hypothetical protein
MAKRRYTAEEIVTVLRQVEVAIATGKQTALAHRKGRQRGLRGDFWTPPQFETGAPHHA